MLNPALQVLLKDGTIVDNTYQLIAEDGIVPQGDVVVTTAQLDQLANIQGKKALYITVDDSPETHEFPLNDFDTIFIEFAGFNDGRGYSFAALLRRQGYQGELRAVGDIFKDVLNYLKRSGFDSFVVKEGKDIHEAAAGLNDFKHPYQASTAVVQAEYQTGA
ncbi:DUF934 domain-containing protein [Acinetobacter ursingii]|uniref:DUF934 domain-containing protein n=3 Tax=Acinetobacter TaxID=469 RepID=N9DHE2_9GAMM|nr:MULTISPECIES: DUF934 domain-containing protein [Acinetobacter]ENV74913.1 hypothetical protein F944_02779 [Acinetobacter ursingii DSM 16037 = CIP 107286]ENV80205.1 hypothetical protein F942_00927 [Acinetobacter ursingii ANC 3649]MCU4358742.1 DUF934 domain-containing protein [Acinetobacter ursingii]MCU4487976.1 DUF934 domain-containing protein [Acinetobacter ursingii]MCU4497135.1 DUF934 domain-containing protein [Acinetobacter ursingii]